MHKGVYFSDPYVIISISIGNGETQWLTFLMLATNRLAGLSISKAKNADAFLKLLKGFNIARRGSTQTRRNPSMVNISHALFLASLLWEMKLNMRRW